VLCYDAINHNRPMDKNNQTNITININPSIIGWLTVVFALLAALFLLRELVLATITAVVVAAAISPAARWFVAYRIPRVVAVLIIYAGTAIVLAATFYFLFLPLLAESMSFVGRMPTYFETLEAWNPLDEGGTFLESYPVFRDITSGITISEIVDEFQNFVRGLGTDFTGALLALFGGVFSFALIVVLSFYLSVQENGVKNFIRTVTPVRYESYILDLWQRAETKIGLWLQGQIILAVLVAVMVYLGLTLIGVPHALLLAVLAGVMELIPVFGPILAAIPAILVAFSMGDDGVTTALIVTGLYIIIQQFESQLVYPLVVQKVVGLSPIIVILSLVAGFQLAGLLGVLLSVPVSALGMELFKDLQKHKHARPTEPSPSS